VRISGSNAGYTAFRGSVKGTGYLLHSPVSSSLPLPYVTVCPHISAGVYLQPFPGECLEIGFIDATIPYSVNLQIYLTRDYPHHLTPFILPVKLSSKSLPYLEFQ
jgi:hypothetical protein